MPYKWLQVLNQWIEERNLAIEIILKNAAFSDNVIHERLPRNPGRSYFLVVHFAT